MRSQCSVCLWAVTAVLSVVPSTGTASPLEGKRPVSELYVAVGSVVSLPCEGSEDPELDWRLNGTMLTSGAVLTLHNVSLEDRGTYTCHTRDGGLLHKFSLQPGFPPSPPQTRCWSFNYPLTAICSWSHEPEPQLPTQYTATYSLYMSSAVQQCQSVPGQSRQCILRGLQIFSLQPYIVNVTAVNPLGTSTSLLPFVLEDIVKPDPPVNVSVVPGSAKQMLLEWAPPPTWTELTNFPLKYKVKYYRDKKHSLRTLGPYESVRMVLKGLRSGSTYHIQVSAQDLLDLGKASDWTPIVSVTVP